MPCRRSSRDRPPVGVGSLHQRYNRLMSDVNNRKYGSRQHGEGIMSDLIPQVSCRGSEWGRRFCLPTSRTMGYRITMEPLANLPMVCTRQSR